MKYKKTNITSKNGVNYIRSIVEECGSLYHKIETENDLGIDAIIELIRDEKPLNTQVAIQIKSGSSYFNSNVQECIIPVGNHKDYWLNYPLSVIGIVYIPELKCAYWTDIKNYLKNYPNGTAIHFNISEVTRFDKISFSQIFVPRTIREIPYLSFSESLKYFNSKNQDEFYVGLLTLFRHFPNARGTWEAMVRYFKEKSFDVIPPQMIYFLAHIPWHPDIWATGELITNETTQYAKKLFSTFNKNDVVKLLSFINEEEGIARGTLGQSVEAIISSLPKCKEYLLGIINDKDVVLSIREFAAFILAMNEGAKAIPMLEKHLLEDSFYLQRIINHLKEYGILNPYL